MSVATSSASYPSPTRLPSLDSLTLGYNPAVVAGGGFLRTGCGPGPLEPALGNSSEGKATDRTKPGFSTAPDEVRFFMRVLVNGEPMELSEGLSVEALLAQLKVKREYTAVALNREITPKTQYADTRLKDGDKVEIVRPMGGGS